MDTTAMHTQGSISQKSDDFVEVLRLALAHGSEFDGNAIENVMLTDEKTLVGNMLHDAIQYESTCGNDNFLSIYLTGLS